MSILIKGMEMPDSCFHCKLAEVCQHYKAEHYANKRHEDCPLEEVPSAQPTEASCWGCNCTNMERLKEQKTFSEMIHLHDAETHDKRTETHACDLISRKAAIDSFKADDDGSLWKMDDIVYRLEQMPSAQPEIIHCRDCEYGEHDDYGYWYCRGFGCAVGDTDGSGYCSKAERREDG